MTEPSDRVQCEWTLVFDTATPATALKLLERVLARMDVRGEIDLAPWGELRDRHAATVVTPVENAATPSERIATVMTIATEISFTWTLDLTPRPDTQTVFQGWTPLEYRRFPMKGIYAASFVVRDGFLSDPPTSRVGRLVSLHNGVNVRVLSE